MKRPLKVILIGFLGYHSRKSILKASHLKNDINAECLLSRGLL